MFEDFSYSCSKLLLHSSFLIYISQVRINYLFFGFVCIVFFSNVSVTVLKYVYPILICLLIGSLYSFLVNAFELASGPSLHQKIS